MSKEFEEIVLKKLEKLDVLEERLNHTDKLIQEETDETNRMIRELKQDFAIFDYEINLKIDTLFDANTVNNEKHDFFQNKIISLDTKSFNHDIRISNLEDKILTA